MDWSGAFIGGGAIGGSALSSALAFAQQEDQQDFLKKMYKHRYQWARKDMEKAGLNPILMFSGGKAHAPMSGGGQLPSLPDFGKTFTSAAEAATRKQIGRGQVALLGAQTMESSARANLMAEQADTQRDVRKELGTRSEVNEQRIIQLAAEGNLADARSGLQRALAFHQEELNQMWRDDPQKRRAVEYKKIGGFGTGTLAAITEYVEDIAGQDLIKAIMWYFDKRNKESESPDFDWPRTKEAVKRQVDRWWNNLKRKWNTTGEQNAPK